MRGWLPVLVFRPSTGHHQLIGNADQDTITTNILDPTPRQVQDPKGQSYFPSQLTHCGAPAQLTHKNGAPENNPGWLQTLPNQTNYLQHWCGAHLVWEHLQPANCGEK